MVYGLITPEDLRGKLAPGGPWADVVCLDVTDSTNSRAMAMADGGAPHGTVVVADAQTGGRGRFGRQWLSPPGRNVYVSLLLRPEIPDAKAAGLSLVAGVALADAVEGEGVPALLKWPNDLYLGERKAGGILVETANGERGVRHVVIGVGINVNLAEGEIPGELLGKATSLMIHAGRPFPRADILARFLDAFARRYGEFLAGGFAALLPAWARCDMLRGRRALVRTFRGESWGVSHGVDGDGALLFRPDGAAALEKVTSGEVVDFERVGLEPTQGG